MITVRKILLGASVCVLPATLLTFAVGGPAAAGGGTPFSGPAVGKVTCTGVTVKASFSPPATNNAGGNTVSIKGKLSSCSVTGTPPGVTEVIQQGKITSSSTGAGTGCAGFVLGTTSPVTYTIVWKGKYNGGKATFTNTTAIAKGSVSATDSSGNSGFEVPNPSTTGSSASGSFAGSTADESFLFSAQSATAIGNLCAGHGLKKLNLTHGTVVIP
jgi:hypothetical protein